MSNRFDVDTLLPAVPVRALIGRIGLTIAVLVAVSLPACYWILSTGHLRAELEFKSQLNAGRIAQLIYANEQLAQYQGLRIAELIDLGDEQSQLIRQRVFGPDGRQIAQVGEDVAWPSTVFSQPITIRGEAWGRIDLETSLLPYIYTMLLVSVFSTLLGIGALFVLRVLPLAMLDRTVAELEKANASVRSVNGSLAQKNAELEAFNQSLGQLVAERTAEATAAAEEARKASQVKSAFLASMSHEIRTPMNGVFGMADLLSRTELTSQQRRLVMTINQSASTLLTIINDILDLSRIEAGKMELDRRDFDLRECVESAVEIFGEDAHKKGLDLTLMLPGSLPAVVNGDAGRLRQVLTNLLGNAVKFTREGEISVRVAGLAERGGRHVLQFTIADTGIGIDATARKLLFRPFSQADSTISRRFGGTGLGLSITQHLVRLMGGDVTLESELGKGTTVTFTVELGASSKQDARPLPCPNVLRGQRVLVVDDRASNREIICSYLADCGAVPSVASSAEQALHLMRAASAEARPYALAILDMILPGMNGLELARRMKADAILGETRLVMLTSLSWKSDCMTAREAGISEFLSKPIRRNDLLEAVRRALTEEAAPVPKPEQPRTMPVGLELFRGKRVLVAEDNPVNQEVILEYARQLAFDAVIAENGRVAVEDYIGGHFDIVLMDCQMPEMDGLAACRKIRAFERQRGHARTPVIAVTANAYDSDRVMCLAAEMDDFMSKPFTARRLAEVLGKWLKQPGTAAAETQSPTPTAAPASAATERTAATFDPSLLAEFEGQQPGMAARLAELFLSTAPKGVRQVMMGVVESDREKIRTAAHALKSSCATIGAAEMARLAARIEAMARSGDAIADCLMQAALLEAELAAVETALGKREWMARQKRAV